MRIKSIIVLLVILLALGGGYFYFSSNSEPVDTTEPQLYVWKIDMDEIEHIVIRLPREDMSQSFIKISHDSDFPWFFDDPQHSAVDVGRWGGGIPLLLSGPGTDRVIAEDATIEQLTEFGLTQPKMEIILTMDDEHILNIKIGDRTPNGYNDYVQAPSTNDVALVDYTWYDVLERLVKEPPYASSSED